MGLRGEARAAGRGNERASALGTEPLIASSLDSGLRRQLIESGTWDAVRAAATADDPIAVEWIDTPIVGEWVPIERHLRIMRALAEVVGDEGTREVGGERLRGTLHGGVLAPILRGWLRSYAGAPVQLLRVAPHAWSAVMRNAGRMHLVSSGEREVRFRVSDAPEAVVRCAAWHRFLEGYVRAFLEQGSYVGRTELVPAPDHDAIDMHVSWR